MNEISIARCRFGDEQGNPQEWKRDGATQINDGMTSRKRGGLSRKLSPTASVTRDQIMLYVQYTE